MLIADWVCFAPPRAISPLAASRKTVFSYSAKAG
jgi:hypothetical protein